MIWKNKPDVNVMNNICLDTMVQNLGMLFTEVGDDYIVASMPVDSKTVQPMRILHGGASVALAETLGSVASMYCIDVDKYYSVGIEINANHLKSVKDGDGPVFGKATPIRLGRKIHVWNIEIRDKNDNLVCISRLSTMVIKKTE